jgi:tetratricopeptide (TPR) repeat protein
LCLKASSKLELRLDEGQEDKRQFLIYNAIEGKINPNTTLFAKANLSQTKNTTLDSTEAQYKEFVTGVAYRPVNFDRLNLLGRYTYLEDNSPSGQTDFKDIEKEKSHTLAGEAVYDLTNRWQLVEKLAYKQGALIEVARKVGEFVQVGLGYNFTNFNDDLTHLDYTAQGSFIRLTGKFYDRTPEEIERARQRWLEGMIKLWAWELVNDELARPDSPIMQELYKYFYLAEKLGAEGRLKESEELYEKILQIGNQLYQEGKLKEAKEEWQKALEISQDPEMRDYIKESEKRAREEELTRKKEEEERHKRLEAEEK